MLFLSSEKYCVYVQCAAKRQFLFVVWFTKLPHVCILLLAPTVSALQHLLNVCQSELQYLDMAINAKKSVCTRFGSRYKHPCSNLLTSDGREIGVRMLGILGFMLYHLSHLHVL